MSLGAHSSKFINGYIMNHPEFNPTSLNLDDAAEQCPLDINRHGVDQTRCILGTIFMTWRPKENEIKVVVSVRASNQKVQKFEIFFKTSNNNSLSTLTLSPHDEFRLSLYGAELEKLAQIPKISTLAFKLVYSKGVLIEWKARGSEEMYKLNTWILEADEASNPDDAWYGSPIPTILQSKRKQDEATREEIHEETRPRRDKEDQKRRRIEAKDAKRQKSRSMVVDGKMEVSEPEAPLAAVSVQNDGSQLPENLSPPHVMISKTSPYVEQVSGDSVDMADFRADGVVYTALKNIQIGQLANLIGIVTTISEPSRTKTGEWFRFVHIVDPSNQGSGGLKINFFTKKYREWLPHPEGWHVLILRNVKVQNYQDNLVGTGYSNKLVWAAYSPSTNSIYHGQLENVPREEGLADGGFGVLFSPFYEPKEGELRYCSKLSDWWGRLHNIEQSGVDIVRNPIPRRVHRLISEAGPSVQPNGYFDCTVEILKEFLNFNGVHSVYVTDYTHNNQMAVVQSNWCPTSLSEFVLQMEMWDDAAEVARTMKEGEYYHIKNARMRANHEGYLEGKVTQSKIVKLEETDVDENIHLQSLLERKKAWAAKDLANPDTEIEHRLIQDIEVSKFFHCTVELVHADYSSSSIFVTDYTSHPRLGIIAAGKQWSKGLENRIAKIRLSEQQRHIAESAVAGDFYTIKKLRMKHSPTEECFRGFLGGTERLIQVLNRNNKDNEHLTGLLRRRKVWQQKMDPRESPTRPTLTTPPRQSYIHIKDIDPDDTSIQKYRFFARAVDFYPLKLEDAFYQFCKRCNVEVPKSQKACFGCSDFEHEHIQYLYQLYIMIEDEDEKQIMVSINDKCPLLEGLERVYMPNDAKALRNFQSRLKLLLGNLTMVHSGLLSDKKIEIDTPFGVYEVDSWVISNGKRAFCLVSYDKNVA